MALVLLILTPLVVSRMPGGRPAGHQHPRDQRSVELCRHGPRGNSRPHCFPTPSAGLTITVNDIEHIESQSLNGIGVIKIFFQPTANIRPRWAQTTAMSQNHSPRPATRNHAGLWSLHTPASSTPIVQTGLSSKTLPEQQLFDLGNNFLRSQLADRARRCDIVSLRGKNTARSKSIWICRGFRPNGLSPNDIVKCAQRAESDPPRRHHQDRFLWNTRSR